MGVARHAAFLQLVDFGDECWNEIEVEEIDDKPENGTYPRVLEKHGRLPPQDSDPDEE